MARSFAQGSSQYLANANAVVSSLPISMSGWFYSGDVTTIQRVLSIDDDGNPGNQISIYIDGINQDSLRAQAWNGSDQANAATLTPYSANTWTHIAGTFTEAGGDVTATIWKDGGDKIGSGGITMSVPSGLTDTHIGAVRPSFNSQYFNGRLAEPGIWNAALTDAEVAILATGISPIAVRPQSLVAYWPLTGRGGIVLDHVGDYDMSIVNGVSIATHPPIYYPDGTWATPWTTEAPPSEEDYLLALLDIRRTYLEETRTISALQL